MPPLSQAAPPPATPSGDGRRALTRYRVAEVFAGAGLADDVSLLHLRLDTGRTHQIRVHCTAIGHPIVGDRTYGAGRETLGMRRQALHAARLRFAHPITHEALSFSSPWPSDIAALDRIGHFCLCGVAERITQRLQLRVVRGQGARVATHVGSAGKVLETHRTRPYAAS